MNRWVVILLFLFVMGCGTDAVVEEFQQEADREEVPVSDLKDNAHTPDSPEGNLIKNELENQRKLDAFMEKVTGGVPADVRIVRYTTEGAPIYTDLSFDGEKIDFKRDTRRDKNGNGGIIKRTCKSIKKEKTQGRTTYFLSCGIYGKVELLTLMYEEY
ncbi:DUF4362 domain-containing protein [Halobacillus sp. BBL2006]|uniref:DUF4362 domain-containing protein n=1 Tax=Halobacillus sp. BBL2006 TaxID=1543706 RepID=UPI00068A78BA|nr:DUF4362 domain-containing protein [Halobacillus sp. BBL2006]